MASMTLILRFVLTGGEVGGLLDQPFLLVLHAHGSFVGILAARKLMLNPHQENSPHNCMSWGLGLHTGVREPAEPLSG